MKKEIKLGTKIKGFKFKSNKNTAYAPYDMDSYIGRIGIVIGIDEDNDEITLAFYDNDILPEFNSDIDIECDFNLPDNFDDFWYYPLDKAHEHIVHESNELFPIY